MIVRRSEIIAISDHTEGSFTRYLHVLKKSDLSQLKDEYSSILPDTAYPDTWDFTDWLIETYPDRFKFARIDSFYTYFK